MEPLNRFPQVMQEYLVSRVREVSDANRERIFAMRSRKAALGYQDELRRAMRKVFGRMPQGGPARSRAALKSRIVGTLERDGYRVENIIFESRPNFPVTANLYVPEGLKRPAPAVLGVCGHAGDGKACDLYQSFSQGLARKGYVVLIFDPLSQGERLQYPDGKGGSVVGACTREHNWMGRQQILAGEFFGSWRVWDGMRALDYLLSRQTPEGSAEVDPAHIGLTGNSGGGTMTTLLLATDDRFTMAAPGCYVTSWRANAENELPADAEQQPPFTLGRDPKGSPGMELGDLLMLHAPKPLILLTQEQDYFDVRGSIDIFERLRHFWRLLGAEENVQLHIGPRPHGYHIENREAMYRFFNRHCGRTRAGAKESELTIEDEQTLWCTESGQVDELKPATVFDFTRERSEQLAAKRGEVSGEDLLRAARRLLNLPERPSDPPHYRVLRPVSGREWPRASASYLLETDPAHGAQALVYKLEEAARASRPLPGKGPAVLYIPHHSSDADLREDALCRKLAAENEGFFACDYRGIGESKPNSCGFDTFEHIYGSDYFYASYGLMLGEPYLGWRVHDILRTLDFMAQYGYDRVHLVGRGWGAIPAAFAALLDGRPQAVARVERVTLKHAPISYREMAETEMQTWPLSAMLPYVLEHFDLPDVYRALAARKLTLVQPLSAEFKRMRKSTAAAKMEAVGLDEGLLG